MALTITELEGGVFSLSVSNRPWCFGMALVSNGRLLTALSKIAMKGLGARLMGCPCNAFASEASARLWLSAQRSRHLHVGGGATL